MEGRTLSDCLFCKFGAGDIPVDEVYSDDDVIAFRDIAPKAPSHVLVIPRQHFDNVAQLTNDAPELAARVLAAAVTVAELESLSGGFRLITNTGADGGQSVNHVHFHVLGGRELTWPPG